MKRLLGTLVCLSLAATLTGCATCYTPYDDHYNGYGGVVERQDPLHGRVGSILSEAAQPYYEDSGLGEAATQADLYRLESEQPILESIDPQDPLPVPESTQDAAPEIEVEPQADVDI